MTEELITTGMTYHSGRIAINNSFSGSASFQVLSAATFYSGSTNLAVLFANSTGTSGNLWTGGSGSNSIIANNGTGNLATGTYAVAEGRFTRTTGNNGSHSEGYNNLASGDDGAHAEGFNTVASDMNCHSEGRYTTASAMAAHAQNDGTNATGMRSHAQGHQTTASGNASHAGGFLSVASGDYSFVHGSGSTASGQNTIVFGVGITGTTSNTMYVPPLMLCRLTTTERDALTPANGMLIYNTTLNKFQGYENGGWSGLT